MMPTKTTAKAPAKAKAVKPSGPSALQQAAWNLIGALDRATGHGAIHTLAVTDALAHLKAVTGWQPPAEPEA